MEQWLPSPGYSTFLTSQTPVSTGRITCAVFSSRFWPFAFSHVSLYPVPFSINLAESLNSYATDGAIIIIAVILRKTPKNVKNVREFYCSYFIHLSIPLLLLGHRITEKMLFFLLSHNALSFQVWILLQSFSFKCVYYSVRVIGTMPFRFLCLPTSLLVPSL